MHVSGAELRELFGFPRNVALEPVTLEQVITTVGELSTEQVSVALNRD